MANKYEGGTFSQEILNRMGEEILIKSKDDVDRMVVDGFLRPNFIEDLAIEGNKFWNSKERPAILYGTVDGVGNVAETLMLLAAAEKLDVGAVLTLDQNAHSFADSFKRITEPSLPLIGIKTEEVKLKDGKVRDLKLAEVFPDSMLTKLESIRISRDFSLAEAYSSALMYVAVKVFGLMAVEKLSIVDDQLLFGDTALGTMKTRVLLERVRRVSRAMGKEKIVFAHIDDEKIFSDADFGESTIKDLYKKGGWLGGTAWVSLTAMMTDPESIPGGGDLILLEKDTTFGGNFASAYEVNLRRKTKSKIAISKIKRIYANKEQTGGDGVDPLVLAILLSGSDGNILAGAIKEYFSGQESKLILSDRNVLESQKNKLLKKGLGIDGKFVVSTGISGQLIGKVLLELSELFCRGELNSVEEARLLITKKYGK